MSKASSNKISELKSLRKGTPSKQQSQEDGISSNNIPQNSEIEQQNEEKYITSSQHFPENENTNNQNEDKISEIKSINKELLEKQSEVNNKEYEEKQSEINMKENEDIINQQKKEELNDGMTEKEKNTLKSAQEDHEINAKEELQKKAKKILMTEVTNVFDTKDLYHFQKRMKEETLGMPTFSPTI